MEDLEDPIVQKTRYLDKLIDELATSGLGIIMVSSELPEILAISDRVLVMADGRITAEFETLNATEDSILKAAIADNI